METLSTTIRETFPNYLRSLPVPSSFKGFFQLSPSDWLRLTPLIASVAIPTYMAYKKFTTLDSSSSSSSAAEKSKVNLNVKKDSPKVVDFCDIEDILQGDKKTKSYCRCWRSKSFPLCDGSHTSHNDVTGDNVGPLVVKKQ